MPSLSNLEVRTNPSYGCSANDYPWGSINDFLDRSTPPLVNFSLSLLGMTLIEGIPSFMEVVRRLPELATFKLALEYPLGLDTPLTAFYSSLSELLATLTVPSNASAERVIAPKLKKFCLTVTERYKPLSRIKICQEMVSFAASRSEKGLISSRMNNIVLPLDEFMLEIHSSSGVLEKWPSFHAEMSDEDKVKGLWNQVRELTAGGMKCTIEQWGRSW
ncbi:hypothetical protein VNI00_013398 [Paramarasmius palmivorus]|uniref:Uncharacterized protein n=1 Tax=Paramarasmius palmivorus TaxID=297713 RepID=A0AAW0BZJ1_9AGAR